MRWGRVVVVVALVATSFVGTRWLAEAASPAQCNPGDRVETGVQGDVPVADQLSGRSRQGYWCNIRPVGHDDFSDVGGSGADIQLAWSGNCAYQAVPKGTPDSDPATDDGASDGIGVVDVHDPQHPSTTDVLRRVNWAGRGGALGIHEGVHTNDERGILVVPIGTMISVFDISRDCTHPQWLYDIDDTSPDNDPTHSETVGAAGIHSGQISPDGRLYYATDIGNGAVAPNGPCLTVFDLVQRKVILHWGLDFPCHDLDLRPDGKRAYVGYYGATVGHPAAVVGAFTPVGVSHEVSGIRIVDTSELQDGAPNPQLPIVGELTGGRQHTEVYTKIGDREFLLGAEEAYCPNGNGRMVEITGDLERHPKLIAEIPLEINSLPNCGQALYNQNADVLHYMSHYLSVDDTKDATLAFFTWYGSGLRVFDISVPEHPHEVAYFNPPVGAGASRTQDSSTTYPRYVPQKGQIWFGSQVNGLNVVELAPDLRPGHRQNEQWSVDEPSGPIVATGAARLAVTNATAGYCTLLR